MALLSVKGTTPKNAVLLSRDEAIGYQWRQIQTWKNKSDVWIYTYGITALGGLAGACGGYINGCYRRKLKLRDFGFVTTNLPLMVGPAIFSILAHVELVTPDIFLNETKCPVCVQQRAVALQLTAAVVYPVLISPIVNFYMALTYATYPVPYWKDAKGTFKLWWKLTKPLGKTLMVATCVQAAAATFVTYMEADTLYKLKMKLMRVPEETEIKKAENVTVKQ